MERYSKYLVIKWDDINNYLEVSESNMIKYFAEKIEQYRKQDGKSSHTYIVVNQSKAYAGKVWNLIEQDDAIQNKEESNEQ